MRDPLRYFRARVARRGSKACRNSSLAALARQSTIKSLHEIQLPEATWASQVCHTMSKCCDRFKPFTDGCTVFHFRVSISALMKLGRLTRLTQCRLRGFTSVIAIKYFATYLKTYTSIFPSPVGTSLDSIMILLALPLN